MRIALVASPHVAVPPAKYGGSEQVIYFLIKGLQQAGHEPILLGAGDSQVDCQIIPIVEKAIGFPQTPAERPAFAKLEAEINQKTIDELSKLRGKVDIIHSHGFDLLPFADVPNLTTLHCKTEFEQLGYYEARKDKLHYASISKNQQLVFPDLKYDGVVYNGEDPSAFPFVDKPDDYVCFLGRLDREKAPHLAIQLAIACGLKIKVAGKIDFAGADYVEQELKPYFDHPLVEYVGELGFADKVKLLAHAKVNLHPINFREPFGLTVIEAAYCGTPTLAIRRGSMPELIEDGRTGILIEDFIEGYQTIGQCFAMDRQYIADRAKQLFNYQKMTEGYIEAYRAVLEEYGAMKQASVIRRTFAKTRFKPTLPSIRQWRTDRLN